MLKQGRQREVDHMAQCFSSDLWEGPAEGWQKGVGVRVVNCLSIYYPFIYHLSLIYDLSSLLPVIYLSSVYLSCLSSLSLLSLYHSLAIIYQSPLWSINLLAIYHLSISLIYLYHLSYINLLSIYRSSKMENRGDRKMGPNQEVQHKQMWFQRETAKTKTKNKKTLREKNIMRIPQKWRTWERECAPSWTDGLLTKVELWKTLYISPPVFDKMVTALKTRQSGGSKGQFGHLTGTMPGRD